MKLAWLAALLLVVPALAACQKPAQDAPPPPRPVLSLQVEPQSGPALQLAGTIASRVAVDLSFRIPGRLTARTVNVGDRVTQGQVVATIDASALELQLTAAEAELASAQAKYDNALGVEQRQGELYRGGTLPQSSYEMAQLRLKLAQSALDRARGALEKARDQLGYAQLRADTDGIVTAVLVEPGSDVMPGFPVISIAPPEERDAVIEVPYSLADSIPIGTELTVRLQLDPSRSVQGRVREVAPEADPAIRTRRVKIGLIDPPPAFRIGSTVSVATEATQAAGFHIPATAVLDRDGRSYVWLVDAERGAVSLQEVEIASRDGGDAIVTAGLSGGMRIAVAGVNSLTADMKIRVSEDAP